MSGVGLDAGWIVKLDPMGNYLWGQTFPNQKKTGFVEPQNVVVDGLGNVYVSGNFSGAVDFGGGTYQGAGADIANGFALKLDANGKYLWSFPFGSGKAYAYSRATVLRPSGELFIVGGFDNSLDLGGGPLLGPAYSTFLARFGSGGNHLWSEAYSASLGTGVWQLAQDVQGDLELSANFAGVLNLPVDLGGAQYVFGGSGDNVYIVKFDN